MKTNLDKHFKADEKAEKEGVDFVISDTCAIRVTRWTETNPRIAAAMAANFKPFAKQIQLGTLDPKKELEVMTKVFVNSCVVGWRGVEIDGAEAEFSKEAAVQLFVGLPDLFKTLFEHSKALENYREEVGNS